ncbi:MAG: hypothetical protein WBB73_10055 [Candidatus Aminicenantaceae bacterium]
MFLEQANIWAVMLAIDGWTEPVMSGNIFWVDAGIIKDLKSQAFK